MKKFQRRLTFVIGLLLSGAIILMGTVVAWNVIANILEHYEEMAVSYSTLATRYVRDTADVYDQEQRVASERLTVAKVNLLESLHASGSIPPGQSWDIFSELLDRSLHNLLDAVLPPYSLQRTLDDLVTRLDLARAAVVDSEGTVVAMSRFDGGVAPEVVAMARRMTAPDAGPPLRQRFGRDMGVATRLELADGRVYGLFLQHRIERGLTLIRNSVLYIAGFTVVLVGLALFVAHKVGRQMSRPIDELARGMRKVGEGNLDFNVQLESRDEIQEVAQAVGEVVGSLRTAMDELEQETLRREVLEHELHIAAELQSALLPKEPPHMEGFDLLGWSRAAREVGGDFYDFIQLSPGRVAVVIGDATGKGLPAALLVNECWSILRTLIDENVSPAEFLARINRVLNRRVRATGRFVTLFLIIIDTERRLATYASAGHNPPLLVGLTPDRCQYITHDEGLPLGVIADARFSEHELTLEPGDTLLLYSDGLTEAQNAEGEIFGEERVQTMVSNMVDRPLLEVLAVVKQEMDDHIHHEEIFDDVTLVGVRYLGNGAEM
ncbi:MAG: SpoIIE family protein phosphatase [FCB group bacterium]|jgi:serine phosphatase RsbU (regulator of sigma subunit)|nr:SpoIIE family protein phosphatase [FCB group bacterium]